MKNILSLFFLIAVSCKNNKIISKDFKATENKELINTVFDGRWKFESMDNKDSLQNKTFEINLYNNENKTLLGNYCSVSRNGNKIDCFEDEEPNVTGEIINDTLYIDFISTWENSKGRAKLYFIKKDLLNWKIINSQGELYLPDEVVLAKAKE